MRFARPRPLALPAAVAGAVLLLATAGPAATQGVTASAASRADAVAALRPPIRRMFITFGPRRQREMRAYAMRHYGIDSSALKRPHVIVEHFTASTTVASAYATFARDVPDSELHELPGTCAHFIVGRDGTIYQLVSIRRMCRHTVGLNYTAIGIEHVGLSDQDVVGRAAELQASLRLTHWLRCREQIGVPNVIGHNESLSSPYHREQVARLKSQTHGDMTRATMTGYRRKLRAMRCPR
ncbi:MAG: N-acetylmuramoyl-L-alanine amidase [Solirubrobacterales bacterium]|nr:N-acetylmuramoyl-L-alanine amidase [Solirubrobacterales bacterium]